MATQASSASATSLLVVKLYTLAIRRLASRFFATATRRYQYPKFVIHLKSPLLRLRVRQKLHTQGQADIFIHLQDKRRYLQIVLLNRCEGADQSQSGLWGLFTP
jgi:hypothetical protein